MGRRRKFSKRAIRGPGHPEIIAFSVTHRLQPPHVLWSLRPGLHPSGCGIGSRSTTTTQNHPDTSQEAVVFEQIHELVRFENDGSGTRENTTVVRVQSTAGAPELGQLVLGYSSATEDIQIKYVRVRKPDGEVVETSTSETQDFAPEILRQPPMYSDYRQKHLSVANLQPGDVLEYQTYERSFPWSSMSSSKSMYRSLGNCT